MARKANRRAADRSTSRVSVSFTAQQYDELVDQAKKKRVSMAWVVRDAVDQYLRAENPLFFLAESETKEG